MNGFDSVFSSLDGCDIGCLSFQSLIDSEEVTDFISDKSRKFAQIIEVAIEKGFAASPAGDGNGTGDDYTGGWG